MTPLKIITSQIVPFNSAKNKFASHFLLHWPNLNSQYIPASRMHGVFSIANQIANKRGLFEFFYKQNPADLFSTKLNQIADEFSKHPAIKHPLFDYLGDNSDKGLNKLQYAVYYHNFLYRTKHTIPSVAFALARAAIEGDMATVAMHGRNLGDETGHGNPNFVHSKLLMDAHNHHGKKIFDLDPLTIKDLDESTFITPETREYCEMKDKIFKMSYPPIAGNMWAHEFAADDMLINFRKGFFEPYKSHYSPEEWKDVMKFFDAHRDEDNPHGGDVEAEHERMARQAVVFSCKGDVKKLEDVREGGLMFLDAQAKLWDSLLRECKRFEKWMPKVPVQKIESSLVQEPALISEKEKFLKLSSEIPSALEVPSTIIQRSFASMMQITGRKSISSAPLPKS